MVINIMIVVLCEHSEEETREWEMEREESRVGGRWTRRRSDKRVSRDKREKRSGNVKGYREGSVFVIKRT